MCQLLVVSYQRDEIPQFTSHFPVQSLLPSSLPLPYPLPPPPLLHSAAPHRLARLDNEPRARLQAPLGQERPNAVWLQRYIVCQCFPPNSDVKAIVCRPIFNIIIACLTVDVNQIAHPGCGDDSPCVDKLWPSLF